MDVRNLTLYSRFVWFMFTHYLLMRTRRGVSLVEAKMAAWQRFCLSSRQNRRSEQYPEETSDRTVMICCAEPNAAASGPVAALPYLTLLCSMLFDYLRLLIVKSSQLVPCPSLGPE
jgi:hypothetical protein